MIMPMLKEKLFKFLYPKRFQEIKSLQKEKSVLEEELKLTRKDVMNLFEKTQEPHEITLADFMRFSFEQLGIPSLDFSNIDEEGKPSHYLAGLSDIERKNFIASMESMYADDKFQKIVSYVINLIGNHAIQKADDEQMKNGKIGIIGIRTLMAEFINAHQEYVDSKKPVEGFDPLATLPE